MITGICDCGAVHITVPAPPATINACPCDWCIRLGARWGYYPPASVMVTGATDTYRRASRRLDFHRCRTCGLTTHWIEPTGHHPEMGVMMTLFPAGALAGVPVVCDP